MSKQRISPQEVFRLRELVAQTSRINTLQGKKISKLEITIKSQALVIKQKDITIEKQAKLIEKLSLHLEELNKIIFKPKKKKDTGNTNDIDNDDKYNNNKKTKKRSKDSYKRKLPKKSEITKEINHSIDNCPICGNKLTKKRIIVFYEEDIELPTNNENKLKVVKKHIVEKGYCSKCKKYHRATKIPSTKVVIGKNTRMYITYLAILLRSSYQQITKLFKDTYDFKISEGEISNILSSEAQSLKPEFKRIKEGIYQQRGIHMDETPYKVHTGELGNYAWLITGTDNEDVVFDIGKSRGKGVAKRLLNSKNKELIGISDDYNAYSKLFKAHQLCWAHPHRKLRDLANSSKLKETTRKYCEKVYLEFKELYSDLQDVVDKDKLDKENKLNNKLDKLNKEKEFKKRLIKLTKLNKKDPEKLVNIKKGLFRNQDKYFTCLHYNGIPLDNNKAERNLRHLVLKRKISFGVQTQKGATRLSILTSVLLSLWNRNPDMFFKEYTDLKLN